MVFVWGSSPTSSPQVHEQDMAIKPIGSSELPQVKVSVTGWPQTAGIHSRDGSLIWIVAFRSGGLEIQPGDWNILGLYVCMSSHALPEEKPEKKQIRRSRQTSGDPRLAKAREGSPVCTPGPQARW